MREGFKAGDVDSNHGSGISRNIRFASQTSHRFGVRWHHSDLFKKKIDILAITEHWLRPHDTAAANFFGESRDLLQNLTTLHFEVYIV